MQNNAFSRRAIVKAIGAVSTLLPFSALVACDGDSQNSPLGGNMTGENSWAVGGTNKIQADYPNTDIFEGDAACSIRMAPATTEGPCYYEVQDTEDISAGYTGLPMQLCLQVTDSACQPIVGARVEVWHCDVRGVYSADATGSADAGRFAGRFCSGGDAKALVNTWYRGAQVSNSEGRVNFKSCFPGWYPGRTIHIHFRVRSGGADSFVSQLAFTDALCDEICSTHPKYAQRGMQDTPLQRDGVFRGDLASLTLSTTRNSDNTLLAYKRIAIA